MFYSLFIALYLYILYREIIYRLHIETSSETAPLILLCQKKKNFKLVVIHFEHVSTHLCMTTSLWQAELKKGLADEAVLAKESFIFYAWNTFSLHISHTHSCG